jgi:hypothetical protein
MKIESILTLKRYSLFMGLLKELRSGKYSRIYGTPLISSVTLFAESSSKIGTFITLILSLWKNYGQLRY